MSGSITQSSKEIYEEIEKKLKEYHKVDSQKLANFLRSEKGMSYEAIGRILGMSHEAVRQKYFDKTKTESTICQDKDFIKDTLFTLENHLERLDKISVHNNDLYIDDVNGVLIMFASLKAKMHNWLIEREER